jgi:hypothetical protein
VARLRDVQMTLDDPGPALPGADGMRASRSGWRESLTTGAAALAMACLAAVAVALAFRLAWRPKLAFYTYNVPIAVPFAAFFLERLSPAQRTRGRLLAVDAVVVALALARVFAPPLPFASGHVLFCAYAAATAWAWPLRLTATLALVHILYVKLAVWGDLKTPLIALALAAVAATVRRRLSVARARDGAVE